MFSPTSINYFHRFLGVLVLILFFFPSLKSFKNGVQPRVIQFHREINFIILVMLLGIQFVSVNIATYFYTGSNPVSAVIDTLNGANTYSAYQTHFKDAGISGTTPLTRFIYIILLTISKLIFIVILTDYFVQKSSKSFIRLLFLFTATGIYLSFGLARGTFFEVFEIAVAYVLVTQVCKGPNLVKKQFSMSQLLGLSTFFALPILFIFNTMRRFDSTSDYFNVNCSSNFCFNPYGVVPSLEYILFIFSTYFSNGLYILAELLDRTLRGEIISYLIPLQSYFDSSITEKGVRGIMCENYVNCNFVWVPELITLISIFGIFSLFAVLLLYQLALKIEMRLLSKFNLFSLPVLYFLLLFILSLPVGNFFTISSSSILCAIITTAMWNLSKRY